MIKFGRRAPADVEERLPRLVDVLAKDERLEAVWLFGSRARGEADALSDVDLAALARRGSTAAEIWDCQLAWTSQATTILGTDEVAVQVLNRLPIALRHGMLSHARLLWARREETARDFESETLERYLDFKPYLDRYDRELFSQGAAGKLR